MVDDEGMKFGGCRLRYKLIAKDESGIIPPILCSPGLLQSGLPEASRQGQEKPLPEHSLQEPGWGPSEG